MGEIHDILCWVFAAIFGVGMLIVWHLPSIAQSLRRIADALERDR